MTVEWFAAILSSVVAIACVLLSIADARRGRAQERLHERLDTNDETTRDQGMKIAKLEEHIEHLPTAESIGKLHEKVNAVGLTIAEVKGGQVVMTELLSRLLGNGHMRERNDHPR